MLFFFFKAAAILIQNENKKRARTGRQPVSLFPAGFMAEFVAFFTVLLLSVSFNFYTIYFFNYSYPSHYPMLGSIFLINALVFAAWHFKGIFFFFFLLLCCFCEFIIIFLKKKRKLASSTNHIYLLYAFNTFSSSINAR